MQTLDLTPALPFVVIGAAIAAISYATMVLPGDRVAKRVKGRFVWSNWLRPRR